MKKLYSLLLASMFAGVASAQYCTPTCSNPTMGCTYGPIRVFQVTGMGSPLVDTMGCTGSGYEDRHTISWMTCTMAPGGTYSASFNSIAGSFNTQAWIDYNNDGAFSAGETLGGANYWGTTTTFSFTVPAGTTAGSYRLRFVTEYGSSTSYPYMNPCMGSGYNYGDARDYTVTIVSPCTGTPTPGTATATTSGSCGYHYVTLSDAGASSGTGISYQWQASTDGGATWSNISGATAITYTLAEPTVTTMYRCVVTCSGSSASASTAGATITMNRVSGHIAYSSTAPDTTSLKVWLIDYNAGAGTLTAIDSQITCLDSLSPYFEFNGMGAATYLVKAQSLDVTSSMVGASGYVPTYGASSAHWSGAANITHTTGVSTQNITMAYGTVTAGPGFIGGLISSGAGKNTATDVPAANMLVLLKNTASGILTQTYTDATGAYSFAGIAYGTYVIYPEAMGFATTVYPTITLSASHASQSGANFKQYNTSKTIKPVGVSVGSLTINQFSVAPNPSVGDLNIVWGDLATGKADVVVTNLLGQTVYSSAINIDNTGGFSNVNLRSLSSGLYIVKIQSETINFSEKLILQN